MNSYDNPSCKTLIEFEEDLKKFNALSKLCMRDMNEIETHLLLNYTMTLLNVFNTSSCINMMFFKVEKCDWFKLKTVLSFLGRMPEKIYDVESHEDIKTCANMMRILKTI